MSSLQSVFSLDEMTAYQVEFIITYILYRRFEGTEMSQCCSEINCVE